MRCAAGAPAVELRGLRRAADASRAGLEVDVLTPPSTVAALAAGYRPTGRSALTYRLDGSRRLRRDLPKNLGRSYVSRADHKRRVLAASIRSAWPR